MFKEIVQEKMAVLIERRKSRDNAYQTMAAFEHYIACQLGVITRDLGESYHRHIDGFSFLLEDITFFVRADIKEMAHQFHYAHHLSFGYLSDGKPIAVYQKRFNRLSGDNLSAIERELAEFVGESIVMKEAKRLEIDYHKWTKSQEVSA